MDGLEKGEGRVGAAMESVSPDSATDNDELRQSERQESGKQLRRD